MKWFLLLFLPLLGFVRPAAAADRPAAVYTAAEAANHVGEVATVVGWVDTVRVLASGRTLMNVDGRFPKQTFTIVIPPEAAKAVGDVRGFEGKRVRVTGKISEYKGKPEVEVTNRTQLGEDKSS